MNEILKQKFADEMKKLPKINQDAINSVDWINITNEIGKKYLINDSEIELLQVETGLVLVGLIDLELFALNIEYNIGTSAEEAKKIGAEMFEKVFYVISNKMESFVKTKLETKTPRWNDTINFIISGGDYSFFLEK